MVSLPGAQPQEVSPLGAQCLEVSPRVECPLAVPQVVSPEAQQLAVRAGKALLERAAVQVLQACSARLACLAWRVPRVDWVALALWGLRVLWVWRALWAALGQRAVLRLEAVSVARPVFLGWAASSERLGQPEQW